jgi:LuxR family maltose regulon positive regulatory protein
MADPPTTTRLAAAASERDVLLATKLHLPRPRPGLVPRPRLLERLSEGTARELTLVCAPAGFGKTALLADWSRRHSHPVAWLSLDAGDNDPARFWGHAVAALGRARAGVGEHLLALLRTSRPPPLDTVKKHLTHIFGKLGAASRTQAVARARQLGFLP